MSAGVCRTNALLAFAESESAVVITAHKERRRSGDNINFIEHPANNPHSKFSRNALLLRYGTK